MNESFNPAVPPPIPVTSEPGRRQPEPPLGQMETDHQPVASLGTAIEAVLRDPRRVLFQLTQPQRGRLLRNLIVITLFCSVVYGFVVGTFSGGGQLLAAPVKIALGLLLSALICLPSLCIFSCLSGARARLSEICGLLAAFLAVMTILLIGFAPVAWVFSQSTASVVAMGTLHLLFWFVATGFGLRLFERGFRHCGAQDGLMRVWTVIFLLVALQMSTALRPLVGTAPTLLPETKQFFIAHWMDSLK